MRHNDKPLELPATEWVLAGERFIEINVLDLPWEIMYELKRFLTDKEVIAEGKMWFRVKHKE